MEIERNIMANATYERLQGELLEAEAALAESDRAIGEAAGDNRDWHDNFGFEEASRQSQVNYTRLAKLREILRNAEVIRPRQETDYIDLGNTIVVQFEGEDVPEEFTLLGPHDSSTDRSWISYKSQVGSRLIGQRVDDYVFYDLDGKQTMLRIISVLPGKFDVKSDEK